MFSLVTLEIARGMFIKCYLHPLKPCQLCVLISGRLGSQIGVGIRDVCNWADYQRQLHCFTWSFMVIGIPIFHLCAVLHHVYLIFDGDFIICVVGIYKDGGCLYCRIISQYGLLFFKV